MIEESAVVVAAEADSFWVETQRQSACGSCTARSGCGAGILAAWRGQRRTRVQVNSALPLQVGDTVVLGLAEGALLRGALLVYGLPISLLLAGGLLGQAVFGGAGEEPVALVSLVGLGLGLLAARALSRRWRNARLQPVVLRRLNAASSLPSVRA